MSISIKAHFEKKFIINNYFNIFGCPQEVPEKSEKTKDTADNSEVAAKYYKKADKYLT